MLDDTRLTPLDAGDPLTRLAGAREALRAAQYDRALELIDGYEDWDGSACEEAVLLKAETLSRRNPIAALEWLARTNDLLTSPVAKFGYLLASGKAYANSRNFDSAHEMFRAAEELVDGAGENALARLGYQRARLRWMMRDFDPHAEEIAWALRNPDATAQLQALNIRGWMYAGLEQFERQIVDASAALRIAEQHSDACDLASIGTLLHSTSRLAFELGHRDAIALAQSVYECVPWTNDLRIDRFQTVRAFAWDAFIQGEPARAQWLFKDSKTIAPSVAWQVMAHLDRAYVARISDNEPWAMEELAQAHTLARNVQWGATLGEERLALVTLALLFAPVDMGQAQRYVSTYIALGTENVDPTLAIGGDRRAIGFEKFASARVHQVLGNSSLAIRSYETAYDIFAQINFHYRAAIAAMGLWETTKMPSWLDRAKLHAAHVPNSPIAAKLNAPDADKAGDHLAQLSPMQQQLAHALCEGLEMAALCERFSRSSFTLQRQIDALYEALGVRTRAELRDELQRRGVK
jgi:tetratricopeptide (TPR) repeat protein